MIKCMPLLTLMALLWSCSAPAPSLAPPTPEVVTPGASVALVTRHLPTSPDPAVRHVISYPTRVALGSDGTTVVSDARLGSVFVLDGQLRVVRELKQIARPLGVARDTQGRIYVGSGVHQTIEVYNAFGGFKRRIGEGRLLMPNDLALDREGRLYVADSTGHRVQVFEADGSYAQTIGANPADGVTLRFPTSVAVSYLGDGAIASEGELYVADQGSGRILVFDLEGRLLRQFGERAAAFSSALTGQFARLQGLALGSDGTLHALDSQLGTVQVFGAMSGRFLYQYGRMGRDAGRLLLPLDVAVRADGTALITNAGNGRLEQFSVAVAGGSGGTP